MSVRKPTVAGSFYPSDPAEIKAMFRHFLDKEKDLIDYDLSKKNIIGGVVPHAGYMYSGYEAVHFYEIVHRSGRSFDTVIVINPNHTDYGYGDVNVDNSQHWETPLGKVEVDNEFVSALSFPADQAAHQYEHSGEVQLPFMQNFFKKGFKIVPISMNRQNVQTARRVATEIFNVNKKLNKKILVLASSDFSHYVTPEAGKKLDNLVINFILKLDSESIYEVVNNRCISVCGYGAIMALVEYSRLISDNLSVKILREGNSGEVSSSDTVVDYVSILFHKNR